MKSTFGPGRSAALAWLLAGCGVAGGAEGLSDGGVLVGEGGTASPAAALADEVFEAPGATFDGFGDPSRATNGVRGGGPNGGSFDVYSLDDAARPYLSLGWSGRRVMDGPGADLVVFENAFRLMSGMDQFMDPMVVSVSRDGRVWVDLPHDYVAPDERLYVRDPDAWQGFAGRTPVLLHTEEHPVDPFDPIAAGGDAFDLAALPSDGGEGDAIRLEGARYVRLESASRRNNPDVGAPFPRDVAGNGADIDGVFGRWVTARP